MIEGVDYAWSIPSVSALVAAGKKFAVRYGGPGSAGKQLTAPELARLRAANIDVVANAEGGNDGFRGASVGRSWAASALAHFDALGMPAGRPIYFSVDWDAGSGDWADIDAALRGAAAVIGAERVGVYGSYDVVEHCRKAGTARWLWQTYAWSGGRQHPAAHLFQYRNGVQLGGADLDLTRALTDDYGQWGYQEDDMPLTNTDADVVWKRDIVPNPRQRADAKTNATTTAYFAVGDVWQRVCDLRDQLTALGASLTAAITALAAKDQVDERALATELAPGVAAAVLAGLPDSTDPISQDEVTAAVEAAFTKAFDRSAQ